VSEEGSSIGAKVTALFQKKKPVGPPRGYDPAICTLQACEQKKDNNGELLCRAHWKLVPSDMKRALWKAGKSKNLVKRERDVMAAAQAILDWLEAELLRGVDHGD
jgi:hypothetical protein